MSQNRAPGDTADTLSVGTLIVGAGQAASQLALSLRQGGYTAPILVVGDEGHLPYQRPPLSKAFLAGKVEFESLLLRGAAVYERNEIELLLDDPIIELSMDERRAATRSGVAIGFEWVALTVGGRPRELDVPGTRREDGSRTRGILYLRSVQDAQQLRERLAVSEKVVVIGGGFIGLEFASAARTAGKDVTVIEAAPRLLGRAVPEVVSEFYRQAHERRGTRIILDTGVDKIETDAEGATGVRLSDGRTVAADLVVVGVGLLPDTVLATQAGLGCEFGIVVDESARTSHPAAVAAGDCTVIHPADGPPVRFESVNNAVEQAKAAAATILGQPTPARGEPWFWSDQYDLKLQMVGRATPDDEIEVHGDPDSESFVVVFRSPSRVTAVITVNHSKSFMAARRDLQAFVPAFR